MIANLARDFSHRALRKLRKFPGNFALTKRIARLE